MDTSKKKKKKSIGLQSRRLQVASFCGHNTDTTFHMNQMFLTTIPIWNCTPSDPLQPMKVCKNYSVTPWINIKWHNEFKLLFIHYNNSTQLT